MSRQIRLILVAVMAPLLLASCETWGPTWSEVTGERYHMTIVNRRPTIINRVDEIGAFPDPRYIKVTPGEHRLVLQAPAPGWPGGPPLKVMMLKAEPCMRYYINADFPNPIQPDWTPVVDYVEAIGGTCQIPSGK